ncbi:MAG: lytic transglycosylase domain-containing protein [Mesorhizobium sp.]
MHRQCPNLAGGRRGVSRRIASLLLSGLLLSLAPMASVEAQSAPAGQPPVSGPYARHISDAARRFRIPAHWISAVLDAESTGDPRAVSKAGAMGLMQVMPDTWAELRARHRLGEDPFEVRDNIMAGAAYLREMFDRYGTIGAMLAAYNAGPGRYDEYLATGRPLPPETRAYVAALAPILGGEPLRKGAAAAHPVPADWRDAPLFVVRLDDTAPAAFMQQDGAAGADPAASPEHTGDADPTPDGGLFVPRPGVGGRP